MVSTLEQLQNDLHKDKQLDGKIDKVQKRLDHYYKIPSQDKNSKIVNCHFESVISTVDEDMKIMVSNPEPPIVGKKGKKKEERTLKIDLISRYLPSLFKPVSAAE